MKLKQLPKLRELDSSKKLRLRRKKDSELKRKRGWLKRQKLRDLDLRLRLLKQRD